MFDTLDFKTENILVNTIRFLSADMVEHASSGHPGLPMGMAQALFTLWHYFLRYNPKNPQWFGRDRFVLSAGHGSALLYSMLFISGYDISLNDLKKFRSFSSITPGHPEYKVTPGVEATTGPLGQGFAMGVGMGIAEKWLSEHFNKKDYEIINHRIYVLVSDGDMMEGISSEAASLAGHLGLGNLIYLYDDNGVSLDASTSESYTEDWAKRFEAYHWHVQKIDGMKNDEVKKAIEKAQKDPRPSIIGCKTIIGYPAPTKQGTSEVHGSPLGREELRNAKRKLNWPSAEKLFYIPDIVYHYQEYCKKKGACTEKKYNDRLSLYQEKYPKEAKQFLQIIKNNTRIVWKKIHTQFQEERFATRNASNVILQKIAQQLPHFIGGSADLASSNKTTIVKSGFITRSNFKNNNIRFGVREHAMAGIVNGMALHKGIIPYCGTFLVFSDYLRGAMRLSALMGLRVVYIFTHDSIMVGEDGPTHEPIEHLANFRAIPNLIVIRPSDANEVSYAYQAALENHSGPTAIILSRQDISILDRQKENIAPAENLLKGAYIFYETSQKPQFQFIATGSEVTLCFRAAKLLEKNISIRVVAMPSWELFEKQKLSYQKHVILSDIPKLAVEGASSFGWERWVGNNPKRGKIFGIDRFGESAPGKIVYEKFGFTPQNLVIQARKLLNI